MESSRRRTGWTYAEFARLPGEGGVRHEVIDDALVVTPAPSLRHQRITTDLVVLLHGFVKEHDLGQVFAGPVDVLLAEGDYLEPDIVFVRKGQDHRLTDRGIEGPPDLVVEVTSPSTAARDRGIKLDRYRIHGVPEYWVVDPGTRTVEVWDLAAGAGMPVLLDAEAVLQWTPTSDVPPLMIQVGALLEP